MRARSGVLVPLHFERLIARAVRTPSCSTKSDERGLFYATMKWMM
jgi:hypothetical protein